jgi:hypothetical protein
MTMPERKMKMTVADLQFLASELAECEDGDVITILGMFESNDEEAKATHVGYSYRHSDNVKK